MCGKSARGAQRTPSHEEKERRAPAAVVVASVGGCARRDIRAVFRLALLRTPRAAPAVRIIFIPQSARKKALSDPRSDAASLRARSAVLPRLGSAAKATKVFGAANRRSARACPAARPGSPARRPAFTPCLRAPTFGTSPTPLRTRTCRPRRLSQPLQFFPPHVQSLTSGLSGRCWFAGSHRAPRLLAPWSMTAPALWTASSWSRTASWRPA